MAGTRKTHGKEVKLKVVLEALAGNKSVSQIASEHEVHPAQIKEDWYSRYIVSWRLSATMETPFCVEALRESLTRGTPNIFNTDQGSQFTSFAFTDVLREAGVRISMDGRASYQDNIFTERFWRSVKYEEGYLKDYATIGDARAGLAGYILFYNNQRPHQALAYQTPEQVHFALAPKTPVDMMDNALLGDSEGACQNTPTEETTK